MRRLKKADCEVDFFFIDEVDFSLRSRVPMLSVMPEACQHFFNFFTKYYSQNSSQPGGRTSKKALRLRLPRRPPNVSCLPLFWGRGSHAAEFGEPRSKWSPMWRIRVPPFHGDNVVTIFAKATEEQSFPDSHGSAANFSDLWDDARPLSRNSRARHIYIVDGAPDRGHPPSRSSGV